MIRLPQEAEIASLPFVDQVCPHRKVAAIADQLPADGDVLVHCKASLALQHESGWGRRHRLRDRMIPLTPLLTCYP